MYNPTKPYKKEILKLIESTWKTPYVSVTRGMYPVMQKKFKERFEIQHTDGIGTKGFYHWNKRTFKNAVLDALAMNFNDLAMAGATPYALQNHIVLPQDDHKAILEIVRALASESKKRNIAMTGGETSIHDDVKGMDISITISGFIKSQRKNQCKVGDVLIGLPSSGLHSNGITRVREAFGKVQRPEMTHPTTIYIDRILPLLSKYKIHAMMHITGGAFTKLKDILGPNTLYIQQSKKLRPQKIFMELFKKGITSKEMYSTFNCGVGFVLSVPNTQVGAVLKRLPRAEIIGHVVNGGGLIKIQSAFDNKVVVL